MNFRALQFLIICMMCSHVVHTEERTFSGPAAEALYICDDIGFFACWFALGKSYCRLDVGEKLETQILSKKKLVIREYLASLINFVTGRCKYRETPNSELISGRRHIKCYPSNYEHACWIEFDWLEGFEVDKQH